MNNFDKIFIINLQHRTDRLNNIFNELKKLNVDFNKVERINAVYYKEFGAIGCAMSHRLAINKFINDKKLNNCLILEDDWQIKNYISHSKIKNITERILSAKLNNFFSFFNNNNNNKWDVLLLSGNFGIPDNMYIDGSYYHMNVSSPIKDVYKVVNVQTTSGYAITRNIAKALDDIYSQSIINMKKGLELKMESREIKTRWAMDIMWKTLQNDIKYNWYIFVPTLGKQMDGYSDIEEKTVNYNC